MLTHEYLKTIINYNPETGVFNYLESKQGRKQLNTIGSLCSYGYLRIHIDGKTYKAHRLAWLYFHGTWPSGMIDHINGIKNDNRIKNLRDVNRAQNGQNQHKHRSGHLVGTTWHKRNKKWEAQIRINNKLKHLGYYLTQQEAHEVYLTQLKELNNE